MIWLEKVGMRVGRRSGIVGSLSARHSFGSSGGRCIWLNCYFIDGGSLDVLGGLLELDT